MQPMVIARKNNKSILVFGIKNINQINTNLVIIFNIKNKYMLIISKILSTSFDLVSCIYKERE